MAKATYFKANFTFPGPLVEGFQEVVNGQPTGYFDVNGKPIPDNFLECSILGEDKPPSWAPDIVNTSLTIPESITARIDAMSDDQAAKIIAAITKIVDAADA